MANFSLRKNLQTLNAFCQSLLDFISSILQLQEFFQTKFPTYQFIFSSALTSSLVSFDWSGNFFIARLRPLNILFSWPRDTTLLIYKICYLSTFITFFFLFARKQLFLKALDDKFLYQNKKRWHQKALCILGEWFVCQLTIAFSIFFWPLFFLIPTYFLKKKMQNRCHFFLFFENSLKR